VANGGTGVTTSTGSGAAVRADSPALTTPDLGTPSAVTLTNATGLPLVAGTTGTLTVARGGTGATTLTGVVKGTGTSALTAGTVSLTTEVSGTLPVGSGGTGATTLTANNVLLGNGTSALQAVAPGAAGNILTSNGTTWASTTPAPSGPTMTAVASGSLSDGSRVIINANGTVSVVAGATQAVGSPTNFTATTTAWVSAAYDTNAQKVVIVYYDDNNSGFGTAVVGTVSGMSISFGTPVVFNSSVTTDNSVVYDPINQKVVLFYKGSSNYGYSKVGTVSGTSISFGTQVTFSAFNPTETISSVYDSVQQKIVISYIAGSPYRGYGIVGTVSGTSITFGTRTQFSNDLRYPKITYDSNALKVVIAYADNSAGAFGTAVVGTVSGTSITFGTPVVFSSFITNFAVSATYDSNAQRVVIAYCNQGNSYAGTAIVGTVSGTSITFGTPVVYRSAFTSDISVIYDTNARKVVVVGTGGVYVGVVSGTAISFGAVVSVTVGTYPASTFDSTTNVVVFAYGGSTGAGNVFRNESTNITSENFIGFSNAAYTNGQTATIQIVGSVDDAQSGLTPGQSYFVQNDGTLGLNPGTPSVFAGTAVAANRIIVKG
jgi:hypothetical protein